MNEPPAVFRRRLEIEKMPLDQCTGIFPEMTDREFTSLKEDIRVHGQREPIVTYHGKVIDGRNRLRACQELRIEPKMREWDGEGSLIALICSLNLHRRHLTPSQINAIGVEVEEIFKQETKRRQQEGGKYPRQKSDQVVMNSSQQAGPKARELAAYTLGGSPGEISKAKAVKKANPKLHQDVKDGKITLNQAAREVKRQQKREAIAAKVQESEDTILSQDQGWEIITGDCIQVLETREFVPARLIFADPPYNAGIPYGDHCNDSKPWDEYRAWSVDWLLRASKILAHDGSLIVLINWEWAHDLAVIGRQHGLHLRQTIVWYESFGVNCSRKYNRCSRPLLWFTKHKDDFVWNPEAVNRKSDRQTKYNDKRADPGGKTWNDVWGIESPIPRLVDNAAERLPDFPTQLPLALLRPIVAAHSDPKDLVIDPFCGSGTTGVACIELDRDFVGIEASEKFSLAASNRLLIASQERAL